MKYKQKKSRIWKKLAYYLLFISFFSLASCSSTPNTSNLPNTSKLPNKETAYRPTSGFGGTGYKPSGFGGTGHSSSGFGGTGIVGTITEFGSIWVNGVEIDYEKNTQITSELLANDTLKLGKQVVLETLPLADKTLTTKVHIYYPLAGKITQVDKEYIILNQQYVVKTKNARLDKGLLLKNGEFVAINGFADSKDSWVATRINHNLQQKTFYQPTPMFLFSASVKQVLIESTAQQLKQWRNISVDLNQLSQNQTRLMLRGKIKNNRIHIDTIKPFSNRPSPPFKHQKMQMQKGQRKRMFQQQNNMMKMHRHQGRVKANH